MHEVTCYSFLPHSVTKPLLLDSAYGRLIRRRRRRHFLVMVYACSVTYITCPADPDKTLAIKLPFLILVIKNMKKYFTFEVSVCDCQRFEF